MREQFLVALLITVVTICEITDMICKKCAIIFGAAKNMIFMMMKNND